MSVSSSFVRAGIIAAFLPELTRMAQDAIAAGKRHGDFVLVCADADESPWSTLLHAVGPESELQQHRQAGKIPIILGVLPSEFARVLARIMPRFAEALTGPLPPKYVRCICLAHGGITVYMLRQHVTADRLN